MDRTHVTLVALALLAAPALAGCLGAEDTQPAEAADDGAGSGDEAGPDDGVEKRAGGNETVEAGEPDDWITVERTVVAEDIIPHQPPQNYTYNVEGSDDKVIEAPVNSTVKLTLVSHERNALDHDIKIKGLAQSDVIGPGESLTISFNVTETGPSPYWCTIGDHRERGMEGVLVVNAR